MQRCLPCAVNVTRLRFCDTLASSAAICFFHGYLLLPHLFASFASICFFRGYLLLPRLFASSRLFTSFVTFRCTGLGYDPFLLFTMSNITDIKYVLTQKGLDIFCHKFHILEDVHPQLPSPNQTIHEMPTGKIGVYTRFFEYANFRLPLSTFLVNVLRHYRINLSQLSVIAAAKVSHFEILCRVHNIEPTVGLFHCFYINSKNKGWMSFSKRPDSDDVDSFACPASFPWHTGKNVSRDPFPKSTEFNADHYDILVAHPALFRKFLEPFLCLVGMSRYYTLDEDTYSSFLHDDRIGNHLEDVEVRMSGYSLIPLSRGSFDVIVKIDWLSKRKFLIVCYEKVVRIPLEGDDIFRVHGERTLGAAKVLMNAKVDEPRISDIPVNVMGDALSRKERVKLRRVRGMILAAQSKAFKQENVLAERLHGLEQQMERKGDENLYFMDRIWVLLVGSVMVEAHASSYHLSIRCAPFEALYGRKCRSPVLWAEIKESSLIRLELVQETIDNVVLVKEKPKMERDRQKSYVDYRRKPLEFEVGDRVLLKVTPWKGVVRFGKKGKLAPRYVGPFETLERIGLVAYRLRLPEELNSVHDTFHVSNLKKCLGNANLHVLLNEIKIDMTLHFVEEPVEIMDREIKSLKRSRIPLVKVRWNSKRGPEFTWECEDYMKSKYP
ncbi:hypothetical protein Tco_0611538 [Tanacetum coccineum]